MAKQTFTTGSVLTAAQMNSLQANDYNWTVDSKAASYVLQASDAGKRIEMNAAGATTITVNTGLFTAGDMVYLSNIGAGTCTVTAGTATVNKSTNASLALGQYQSGMLYFVSTSSAIFFPYDVGSSGTTKNFTLINSAALTGATTITISGISNQDNLLVTFENASSVNGTVALYLRINADSGANYNYHGMSLTGGSTYAAGNQANISTSNDTSYTVGQLSSNAASLFSGYAMILGGATSGVKTILSAGSGSAGGGNGQIGYTTGGWWNNSATITSISAISSSGNFDNGTLRIYGSA